MTKKIIGKTVVDNYGCIFVLKPTYITFNFLYKLMSNLTLSCHLKCHVERVREYDEKKTLVKS